MCLIFFLGLVPHIFQIDNVCSSHFSLLFFFFVHLRPSSCSHNSFIFLVLIAYVPEEVLTDFGCLKLCLMSFHVECSVENIIETILRKHKVRYLEATKEGERGERAADDINYILINISICPKTNTTICSDTDRVSSLKALPVMKKTPASSLPKVLRTPLPSMKHSKISSTSRTIVTPSSKSSRPPILKSTINYVNCSKSAVKKMPTIRSWRQDRNLRKSNSNYK